MPPDGRHPRPRSHPPLIAYQPALDGIRAIAVVLVLLFHGGVSWMTGGYVGVSVFFTLSGYLITSLLLAEHDGSGRIRLGTFYARRMKRLLPASLLCIGGVAVLSAAGEFDYVTRMRTDVLGALFQVFNWTKLAAGESYGDLVNATVGRVAPLEHYWSLAIEEQFYFVWPLAALVLLRVVRSARGRALTLAVGWALATLAAFAIAHRYGADAAYWATPARLGEILAGATLAGVLRVWPAPASGTRSRLLAVLAPAGLAVIVIAAVRWPAASGPAYRGWLPLLALASVALIAGVQVAAPFTRLLSVRPLVLLGTISYGVYLYHWPIFAVVTSARFDIGTWPLLALRLAVTLALATVSFVIVERPIRRWNPSLPRVPLLAGLAATAALAVAALVVVPADQPTTVAGADVNGIVPATGPLPSLGTVAPATTVSTTGVPSTGIPSTDGTGTGTAPSTTTSTTAPASTPVLNRPMRIIVTGDSTADALGVGLAQWALDHPDVAAVTLDAQPGCGFLTGGTIPDDPPVYARECKRTLEDELPEHIRTLVPDVVVMMVTLRDVEDHEFGDGVLRSPLDPLFAARLRESYEAMAQQLLADGAPHLAWVLAPFPTVPWQADQAKMADPARYQVQFDVIREVAAAHPGQISVIDMDHWLRSIGGLTDTTWRADGLHFSPESAYRASDEFVVPALLDVLVT